tara:strand:- start:2570 stop:2782 length:213 start_codon:yes stop_codon:yes gene_type:complete
MNTLIKRSKTNIINCKDRELSQFVFNDEKLFINIKDINRLDKLITNRFIYTPLQYDILLNDIEEYLKEIN